MKTKITLLTALLLTVGFMPAKADKIFQKWIDREHHYSVQQNFNEFEVKYKGKILVTDDDKDIKSITPGGYLKIKRSSFGSNRSLLIESDRNGNLSRKYYEGNKEKNFNQEGRAWLEDILVSVIRKTGIGGKERVMRIYQNHGVDGVIDEMEEMDGSSQSFEINFGFYKSVNSTGTNARYMYIKALIDNAELSRGELKDVLDALEDIPSNSTKGSMLREILSKYELDDDLMEDFLYTTSTLSYNTERGNTLRAFQSKYKIDRSNYKGYFDIIDDMSINSEKGNVLKPLLESQKLDDAVMSELLETLEDFSSSSETAAVLRLALTQMSDDPRVVDDFKDAMENISSSHRKLREELMELYADRDYYQRRTDIQKSMLIDMMDMAMQYDPNTYKTPVLRKLHYSMTNDPEVLEKYFEVIESMDYNMEEYNVMLDLIRVHQLDEKGYLLLYEAAEDLARDDFEHGAAAILRESLDNIPKSDDVMEAFFDVLEDIDHNSAKEELIRMICYKGLANKKTIVHLLKTAEDIDVDVETAISLRHIHHVMPKDDSELNYVYETVVEDIESDYEFQRVKEFMQ
jgi:hypothetical protein